MATLEIHNGDCLEIMKNLQAGSVDLFLCDLPYGCLSGRAIGKAAEDKKCFSGKSMGCDWDIKLDLDKFWEQVKRLRRNEHTPCIMFCTVKFGNELINSNPKEFRYDIVWSKPLGVGFLQANKAPLRSHEMIYVFSKAGAYYKRIDIVGDFKKSGGGRSEGQTCYGNSYKTVENDNTGKRCVKSVVDIITSRKKGNHPTEKPMELYKWLIERYCPIGGTVLDPTAGSCNSVFAAYDLDRSGIGIEKDKGFYDKAAKRMDDLPEKLITLEPTT
jgi:site-specific DNA-methyltransferase (adenine-specific)